MLGYTPAIVGIRSEAVRVIECAELLAADLFKNADQTRQRITPSATSSVTWPSWPAIPSACDCGRRRLASRVTA